MCIHIGTKTLLEHSASFSCSKPSVGQDLEENGNDMRGPVRRKDEVALPIVDTPLSDNSSTVFELVRVEADDLQ